MHSRRDDDDTREYLVDAAFLEDKPAPRIPDVCCGTGSVPLAFDRRYPGSMTVGYDFSGGMLHKAMEKIVTGRVRIFPRVSLSHSETGKSRLMSCRK